MTTGYIVARYQGIQNNFAQYAPELS